MLPYFTKKFGNPSSIHYHGREVKQKCEEAREKVANLIGAKAREIIFTSGGTEANNLALIGIALANREKGNHIIVSSIEHHSVLEAAHFLEEIGFNVSYLPVDKFGQVSLEDVKSTITKNTILVSVMHANNEIGTLQDIPAIGKIVREMNIYFHTDAVQSVGNIEVDVNNLNVDLLSFSSHKLYGPKGVGALYVRDGVRIKSLIYGGAQERNKRAGTENVPGIIGFGKACEIAKEELPVRISHNLKLRDKLIKGIIDNIDDVILNGHPTNRLPNNANFSFEHVEGEAVLLNLDLVGISVSSGSACASGSLEPSHVLSAIGLSKKHARASIRFTTGCSTTEEDIDYTVRKLKSIVKRLRDISPLKKNL